MTSDSGARRRIIIASVSFAVIVLLAVAAYLVIAHVLRVGQQSGDPAQDQPLSVLQKSEAAQEAYVTDGPDAALAAYDAAIAASGSDQETAELKRGKATVYFNEDNTTEALKLAAESHALFRTRFSASLLADIYRERGDETNAVKYYNEAIELVGTDSYGDLPLNDEAYYRERLEMGSGV